jgi:hypothetical protein
MKNVIFWSLGWACVSVLAGCASSSPPTARMASAEAATRAAQEVGAEKDPRAELHLRLAQEELDRAHKLVRDGENERADFVLQRASADAELALALARESSERQAAQDAIEGVRKLQQQNQ